MFVQTLLEGGAREASRYGLTGQQPHGIGRETMILPIVSENSFGVIDVAIRRAWAPWRRSKRADPAPSLRDLAQHRAMRGAGH